MSNIITSAALLLALLPWATSVQAVEQPLRAGAYVQDVTGSFDSLLVSGGFTERRCGKMNPGDLKACCFVLQRGKVNIAIAIVDINDPKNLGIGDINYWVVLGGKGAVDKFVKNGGASIRARRIGPALPGAKSTEKE
jgi:hypothetical protein